MSWRTSLRFLPLALLLLLGGRSAAADTIEYTFQGYASGSIGSTNFTNSLFTITLTANSGSVNEFSMPCSPSACTVYDVVVQATSATVNVDGLTTNITSPIGVFDNQSVDVLGLARISGPGMSGVGMDLIDITDPAFATYALSGSIPPVGPADLGALSEFNCSAGCVTTPLGNLTLTNASQVMFTDPISTPEPASLGLLLLGFGLLAITSMRSRTRNRLRTLHPGLRESLLRTAR